MHTSDVSPQPAVTRCLTGWRRPLPSCLLSTSSGYPRVPVRILLLMTGGLFVSSPGDALPIVHSFQTVTSFL